MEVKDEYNSVIGFNVDEITSTCVRGWVEDEETLREVIDVHSIDTLSQFVSWHDDKNSRSQSCTQRILWTHKDVTLENVPFSLDRHIIRQCSFGKAHKRELKKNKTIEKIAMSLMDELLFNRYKDPKHPYSEGKITDIKKLSNTQLKGIFMKHGLLATSYLNSVCLKESLIWLIIMKEQCPYEKADEKCKKTEVCIKDILKEIKQRKR